MRKLGSIKAFKYNLLDTGKRASIRSKKLYRLVEKEGLYKFKHNENCYVIERTRASHALLCNGSWSWSLVCIHKDDPVDIGSNEPLVDVLAAYSKGKMISGWSQGMLELNDGRTDDEKCRRLQRSNGINL